MNLNLFQWIREGVKQAVVLGVTDAVDCLGPTPDGTDMKQRLLEAMRRPETSSTPVIESTSEGPKQRRRLGRSLEQLHTADEST